MDSGYSQISEQQLALSGFVELRMKFIHAADIHLDTPLQGLVHYAGAPVNEIRNATRRAFEKLLDAALAHEVDFVIIAGDFYDVGLKSFESALFRRQVPLGRCSGDSNRV